MNGVFRHFINDALVDEPQGWADFEEELDRNYKLRIIASKYPANLTFTTGAYETLRNLYLDGFCNSASYRIENHCNGIVDVAARGEIIISDIKWNLNKCAAEASVADDGFGARIINNSKIKVFPTSEVTKNDEPLTRVASFPLTLFDQDGTTTGTCLAYDWLECMEHIVAYITDREVSVESDWYGALADTERYCVAYGREVRTGDGASKAPSYSFEELYGELAKKYNLFAAIVRDSSGNPVLKIETEDYWYGTTTVKTYQHVDDLTQSIDGDRLFASIKLGSTTAIKDEDGAFPLPFLSLTGFVEEELAVQGTCNTDSQLDTVSEWVIDTNVIHDAVINGADDYDEDIFLIQYTDATDSATIGQYLLPGSNPWLYNEQLLNSNVAARHHLQLDGVQTYASTDAAFHATLTDSALHTDQQFTATNMVEGSSYISNVFQERYDNDYSGANFDVDNNYGNGTVQGNPVSQANSRYTAPATGYYIFEEHTEIRAIRDFTAATIVNNTETLYLQVRFDHFNSANVQIGQLIHTETFTWNYGNSLSQVTAIGDNRFFNCTNEYTALFNTGDYLVVRKRYEFISVGLEIVAIGNNVTIRTLPGCTFETTFVATGGGNIPADPDQYRVVVYEFERHMRGSEWVSLRDDPSQMVNVATDASAIRFAHLYNAKRNIATGNVTWKLIANRDQALP